MPWSFSGAIDSSERAATPALDPVPGAGSVPLWRSRGPTGLFDVTRR